MASRVLALAFLGLLLGPLACGGDSVGAGVTDASAADANAPDATGDACSTDESRCGSSCCTSEQTCLYDELCVASDNTCTQNEECQNDSYCDIALGYCVPYDGPGPGGNRDATCSNVVIAGVFAPDIQCEWSGPPPGDPYPNHRNVLSTPMVIDFNFDDNPATLKPSIVFVSYDGEDGSTNACVGTASRFGVIRIIDGATCEQQAIVDALPVVASAPVALADLDGANDLRPEIVAHRVGGGLAAFKWDPSSSTFVTQWQSTSTLGQGNCLWSGPSIHDLDDDGIPEVIMGGSVFDGVSGAAIDESLGLLDYSVGQIPVLADLDGDGVVDLVTGSERFSWDSINSKWVSVTSALGSNGLVAVADFGTFGADPTNDDRATLDGIAEIVVVQGGQARLITLSGRVLFGPIPLKYFPPASNPGTGGPPTISDYDGDGRAEFSVAGRGGYNVFDLDCTTAASSSDPNYSDYCNTMTTDGVLWAKPTQDFSSSVTGSSVFDFEGDGSAEVVYADECFSRVYDGQSGEILYSAYRTSCTWYENPIVADVDGDLNSEIVIPSNNNCQIACPNLDPLFDGLRCETDADCPGATTCALDSGATVAKCRCTSDSDCGGNGYVCRDPVAGPSAAGQVCRAGHPSVALQGVRVVRDALDRWVNSRPIWNQHAYSVTNVSDAGKIPRTSTWIQNWTQPGLNNFRQNIIGDPELIGSPDLTSRAAPLRCVGGIANLSAKMCNRGTEAVATGTALSFYDDATPEPNLICTAFTTSNLAPGACEEVGCTWTTPRAGTIHIVADDPGTSSSEANRECHEGNNLATLELSDCAVVN